MNTQLKVKLKPSIYILEDGDNYKFILTSRRQILTYKVDPLVKNVIGNLAEEKPYNTLIDNLSKEFKTSDVKDCLGAMEQAGILRIYDSGRKINEMYKKQIDFIDEFTGSYPETLKLHQRLRDSQITIFGLGGIGSWMANGLSQIGIGKLVLCDPDKIELSNLNRQLFFHKKDVGRYKVDVIKDNLPDTEIEVHKRFVNRTERLEDILFNTNFVVNCADSPSVHETSEIIDFYCTNLDIPYMVSGGYNLHSLMVGPIIIPSKTKTFAEFLEYQKRSDKLSELKKIKDIESTGNISPSSGVVSNLQVMEIFKFLTGIGKVNLNKFSEIDLMNTDISWNKFGEDIN